MLKEEQWFNFHLPSLLEGGGETCFILLVIVLFIKKYLFINRDMLHSIDSWFQDKT